MWTMLLWVVVVGVPFVVAVIYLALCFTSVAEGTAKAVKRFGGFRKIICAWQEHRLNSTTGDIEDAPRTRSVFGGLRFMGLWPIDYIHRYDFFYQKWEEVGGKMVLVDHPLIGINYVILRPDVFGIFFEDAETKGERITVNLKINVGLIIVNPEKALFRAPTNWWQKLKARIVGLLVGFVAGRTYDELLNKVMGHPDVVWSYIDTMDPHFIPDLEDEQGIRILPNKIEIFDVAFTKEVQDLIDLEKKQELQAKADIKKQELEAIAFAAQTSGAELAMVSSALGISVKDLQEDLQKGMKAAIKADPENGLENWLRAHSKYWDLVEKKTLGVRPNINLFGHANGTSLDPALAVLATLVSIIKGGGGPSGGGPIGAPRPTPLPPRTRRP